MTKINLINVACYLSLRLAALSEKQTYIMLQEILILILKSCFRFLATVSKIAPPPGRPYCQTLNQKTNLHKQHTCHHNHHTMSYHLHTIFVHCIHLLIPYQPHSHSHNKYQIALTLKTQTLVFKSISCINYLEFHRSRYNYKPKLNSFELQCYSIF